MDEPLVGEVFKVASGMGIGGMGLLCAILALRFGLQAVSTFQSQREQRKGNGCGGGNGAAEKFLKDLSLQCPLATGRRSLDDIYDVLLQSGGNMVGMKEGLEGLATEVRDGNGKVIDAINNLRLEIAKEGRAA